MHNLANHFDKKRQLVKNAKEKERLYQHYENYRHHKQLCWNAHYIQRESLYCNICKSEPDVSLV